MKRKSKILFSLTLLSIGAACAGALCACGEEKTVTVTFKAVGNEDIVITAKAGGAIAPPSVPEKTGNRGEWEPFDFENVTEDAVVNAVYETEGLMYTRVENDVYTYEVSAGGMSDDTTELFIPARHAGLPVTQIAVSGFWKQDRLLSVSIPEGVKTIKSTAFGQLPFLKSISLPENLTTIERWAFSGCTALESITIPKRAIVATDAFTGCTSLESVTFREGTTRAGGLFNCPALTSVSLPESVTILYDFAFENCIALQTIDLPSGLQIIGYSTFENCTALQTIELPEGLLQIDQWAFKNCTAMRSITIPASVSGIGPGAFEGWTEDQIIYVKGYTEKPSEWLSGWSGNATVVWDA